MIRFTCPSCKGVLEAPEQLTDSEMSCGRCGQRLRVPALPLTKTVLGVPLPAYQASAFPVPAPPAASRPVAPAMPRPDNFVCPACGRKFKVNGRVAGKKTTCIGCGVSLYFTADGTLSTLPVQSRGSPPAPSRKAEGLHRTGCRTWIRQHGQIRSSSRRNPPPTISVSTARARTSRISHENGHGSRTSSVSRPFSWEWRRCRRPSSLPLLIAAQRWSSFLKGQTSLGKEGLDQTRSLAKASDS